MLGEMIGNMYHRIRHGSAKILFNRVSLRGVTVESGLIQTVANVVTRMTIPSCAAQPGSLAN